MIAYRGTHSPFPSQLVVSLLTACCAAQGPSFASAAITIEAVTVDGQDVSLPPHAGDDRLEPVRLPSTARRLEVRFSGAADPPTTSPDTEVVPPPRGTRLRYRLEGIDKGWQDAPASGRVDLSFKDAENGEASRTDFILAGQSRGWRGSPEESAFIRQSIEATAPFTARSLGINILSINSGETVGVVAIDDVAFSVTRAATGEVENHSLAISQRGESFDPLRRPENWVESGTRGRASQLRLRSKPQPHPILVIIDDEPNRYGGWLARTVVRVQPGDRVALSWSAAWSLGVGRELTAEYRNLRPGTYFFHAGAFYPDGRPTGVEVSLPIEVYVPWHLRRDVWAGAGVLALAGIVTAGRAASVRRIQRRLEQIERAHALERERARIARDLHDDVGAGLAEIAMQADWVRNEIETGEQREALTLADGIRTSADDLVRSIDAIVWAVNPANDTLERFASYVVQSTERFLDAAGISMRFEIPDPLPAMSLDGALRHRLFLALREAVHNAAQHGHAGSVTVSLALQGDRLELSVADDGRGFDLAAVQADGTHDGLGNMQKQMAEVGGTCAIRSERGKGTHVLFSVPLHSTTPRSNHHA